MEKDLVEVENEGHAKDALRGIHQIRIPMQCLNGFLIIPRAVEREHPIAWRDRFRCRRRFHLQILLNERRARDVGLR